MTAHDDKRGEEPVYAAISPCDEFHDHRRHCRVCDLFFSDAAVSIAAMQSTERDEALNIAAWLRGFAGMRDGPCNVDARIKLRRAADLLACVPSHVAENVRPVPGCSFPDCACAPHDRCVHVDAMLAKSAPSTTPRSETPRTDALRKLMAEIYEPDNLALDHMLEKYGQLERELTEQYGHYALLVQHNQELSAGPTPPPPQPACSEREQKLVDLVLGIADGMLATDSPLAPETSKMVRAEGERIYKFVAALSPKNRADGGKAQS